MVRYENTTTSMPKVAVGAMLPTREVQGSTFRSAGVCPDCCFSGISYFLETNAGTVCSTRPRSLYNHATLQKQNTLPPLLDPSRLGPIISHQCPCHRASVHVSFATSKPKGFLEIETFMVGGHVSKWIKKINYMKNIRDSWDVRVSSMITFIYIS